MNGKPVWDLTATPAAVRRNGLLTNGVTYTLQVMVRQEGQKVAIQSSLNGQQLISWSGQSSQLLYEGVHSLPNPHAIGFHSHNSIVDVHELMLELKRGGRGYRLGDDWKNPLFGVADQPSSDVARKCLTWSGKKYFISDRPMSLPQAQLLATQLNGRLLTISSADEDQFILKQGRGLMLWMSGWRPLSSNLKWRDERNRPLRYIGQWTTSSPQDGRGNPSDPLFHAFQLQVGTTGNQWTGWDDAWPWLGGTHACIEWGEEYPEEP